MKRSEINAAVEEARAAFGKHGWALPPKPRWDVTDFGLNDFNRYGLVALNLAEQPEYCEKLMYSRKGQETPAHYHASKKEDIICRYGCLAIEIMEDTPAVRLQVNGEWRDISTGEELLLSAGERITLTPGVRHRFWAAGSYAVIGEVSTANDDTHDNFFDDPSVGRFCPVTEDEPPRVRLIRDGDSA